MNRAVRLNSPLLLGAAALAASLAAAPEQARAVCSVLSHHPCTPYFGSVLRRHPFTPYSCGVSGGPCSPEVPLRLGRAPVLRVEGHAGPAEPVDRDHPLDRFNEVRLLLSKCLELPGDGEAQAGMEVALRFALKRNGDLIADPSFTYTTREAPERVKAAYHAAALDMLRHCTPLPLTDGFGSAIAGRPVVISIRDNRDIKPAHPDGAAAPAAAGDSKQ